MPVYPALFLTETKLLLAYASDLHTLSAGLSTLKKKWDCRLSNLYTSVFYQCVHCEVYSRKDKI
jgi:hypothetical protein